MLIQLVYEVLICFQVMLYWLVFCPIRGLYHNLKVFSLYFIFSDVSLCFAPVSCRSSVSLLVQIVKYFPILHVIYMFTAALSQWTLDHSDCSYHYMWRGQSAAANQLLYRSGAFPVYSTELCLMFVRHKLTACYQQNHDLLRRWCSMIHLLLMNCWFDGLDASCYFSVLHQVF